MAETNTKAIKYSFLIFFIVLLLSHEILHVEARHLIKSKQKKRVNYYKPSSNFGSSDPSGPGHSPGVGHSIQN